MSCVVFFDSRVTAVVYDDTHQQQARRQDLAAGGTKNQKEPNTRRGATFLKCSIGCMQQQGGQTRNGEHRFQMGGPGTTGSPLATALTSSCSDPA